MKSYYIYKNWLIRLLMGSLFFVGTIIFMLIEKMKKIPLFVYIIFLSISFLFVLVMTILVLANKEKFLTKIYLYDDYFKIKNTSEILHKVNLKNIRTIRTKKEDYTTFLIIEYSNGSKSEIVEIEYNKNIVLYFNKRNIEIN